MYDVLSPPWLHQCFQWKMIIFSFIGSVIWHGLSLSLWPSIIEPSSPSWSIARPSAQLLTIGKWSIVVVVPLVALIKEPFTGRTFCFTLWAWVMILVLHRSVWWTITSLASNMSLIIIWCHHMTSINLDEAKKYMSVRAWHHPKWVILPPLLLRCLLHWCTSLHEHGILNENDKNIDVDSKSFEGVSMWSIWRSWSELLLYWWLISNIDRWHQQYQLSIYALQSMGAAVYHSHGPVGTMHSGWTTSQSDRSWTTSPFFSPTGSADMIWASDVAFNMFRAAKVFRLTRVNWNRVGVGRRHIHDPIEFASTAINQWQCQTTVLTAIFDKQRYQLQQHQQQQQGQQRHNSNKAPSISTCNTLSMFGASPLFDRNVIPMIFAYIAPSSSLSSIKNLHHHHDNIDTERILNTGPLAPLVTNQHLRSSISDCTLLLDEIQSVRDRTP
jgi:hypothetical protein